MATRHSSEDLELNAIETGKAPKFHGLYGSRELLNEYTPGSVRLGFIRKVYGILTAQLLLTAVICAGVRVSSFGDFMKANPGLLNIVLMCNIASMLAFTCGPEHWRRTVPINYGLLFGFTITEGIAIGFICMHYTAASVLAALFYTSVLVGGLTVYAYTTKHDFTGMRPFLVAAAWGMFLGGLIMMFNQDEAANNFYCACGLVVFSLYLIYDTQVIVGGEHKSFELTVDDYVFGAMTIYIDIIQIFLYILRMVGKNNED